MQADCFKACADLPKRWRQQMQLCTCLGSATNRARSIRESGGRFRFRHFGRNCARGATQSSLCLPCLAPISMFCQFTVYGNTVLSLRDAGIKGRIGHMSFIRKACWNHGRCEMRDGKKESPRCFMKINIYARPLACGRCPKRKRCRSELKDCRTRFV